MLTSENISLLYSLKNPEIIKVGIVYTQWNARLVDMMYYDAVSTFQQYGIQEKNIISVKVPGAIEISFAAKQLAEKKTLNLSGILAIGTIVKGETPHFDYVAMSVTQGITQLNLQYPIPFVFGVLTTNNYQQALERANIKGKEFAISLLNMIGLSQQL
ncbi:MAG: 6,7-dimethyl-8-ribityllumazine synthase [Bacteroidia bacterium]